MPTNRPPYPNTSYRPVPPATVGPVLGRHEQQHRDDQERPRRSARQQRAVGERAQDAAAVLVDHVADAQVAATGERQDPVDPIGQPAQVGQRGISSSRSIVVAVDDGAARSSAIIAVAAATIDSRGRAPATCRRG